MNCPSFTHLFLEHPQLLPIKWLNDACLQRAGTGQQKGSFLLKCKAGALEQNNITKVLTYSKIRLEVLVKLPFAFLSSNLFLTKGKINLCQWWSNMLVANKGIVSKGWFTCRVTLKWEAFSNYLIYTWVTLLCFKQEGRLKMFKYWYMTTANIESLIMHFFRRQFYSSGMPNLYSQAMKTNCLCCTRNSLACLHYNNSNKKAEHI